MADLFFILFLISFICLIVGLINPSIFTRVIKREVTRKKVFLIFGIALLAFFILFVMNILSTEKNAKPSIITTISKSEPTQSTTLTPVAAPPTSTTTTKLLATTTTPTSTITTTTTTTITETKTARDKMIEIFKEEALAEWGDDYQMVNYEVKKQTEAYDWIVKQSKYPDIMTRAKQEWGNDYTMVKYEYEKQVEAYEWISEQTAYPDIMTRAKQEWGNDYTMVKYEYEKQVEAYEAL